MPAAARAVPALSSANSGLETSGETVPAVEERTEVKEKTSDVNDIEKKWNEALILTFF